MVHATRSDFAWSKVGILLSSPREVHLEDRFLDIASQALVALEDLRYELALVVTRHFEALYLARVGHQVALVVAVALPLAGRGELPIVGV